ncbi:ABC-2 family transporter protein [Paenibacillus qinlingensis]|uniref:ABC-2 type transport system permease protein n=1 Tax=Paenibacillus qinlingensis TaxID=1837343 RepID=A0ABU1NX96_9BACL|nr:ABC-2 family transporter protein [Paenibacillus qinlingensis]MDR6552117.1 ABC-2 type transport system permease protein [Paenibacillus qinlingensis]
MISIRLFMLLIKASLRSRMQYKFNFVFSTIMASFIQISEFLMVALVMMKFGNIKGWTLYEVGYLYGVIMISKAIYRTLASDVHHLEKYLVSGDLDAILIRPVPVLVALMTQNSRIQFAEIGQGLILLIISMNALQANGQIGWIAIPQTGFMILTGAVILFAIGLATAAAGFWLTRIEFLQNMTEDASHTAARYPLSIYPKWLQGALLVLVPVGFVNYIPTLYVLRHQGGVELLFGTLAVSLAVLGLAMYFWKLGLSRYQSTGS